jgi:hypothetical protein
LPLLFVDGGPLLHGPALLGQHNPVILVIILVPAALEQCLEHFLRLRIGRSLIETQVAASSQVLGKFCGVALAKDLNGGG